MAVRSVNPPTLQEERQTEGVSWFTLALNAPLIGIRKRWPNVLHAVEMDGLPTKTWPDGLAASVCGKTGVRILAGKDGVPGLWPPAVKGLRDKVRCRECFDACSKKRPRSRYVPKGLAEAG